MAGFNLRPEEAAEEVARQIEANLSHTTDPMQAEVMIQLAASWKTFAFLLTHKCTCGHGGQHNPYNKDCELVPKNLFGGI